LPGALILWSAGQAGFVAPVSAAPLFCTVDWRAAERDGWTLRTPRGAASKRRLETREGALALRQASGRKPEPLEVARVQTLAVPDRFVINLKARFLKLGQEDDSTGQKSHLQIAFGVQTPRGPFGLQMLFTGDRYKIDRHYKVVRTDTAWHQWRFEVDTLRSTVAMYRDGGYVCLHNAGSRQPMGIRLRVIGCAELPSDVEIAALSLEPLEATASAPRPAARAPAADFAPGEWPFWRRDAQNTGFSPLKGTIREPQIVGQAEVGMMTPVPVFLDLEGDGTKEALFSHGGNLSAQRLNGTIVWQQRLENATVLGVYDLDEDGRRELMISAGAPSQLRLLNVADGTTRYLCPLYPMAGVAGARVAKLSPKRKGLQAVIWSPQHEIGFCLSFARGVEQAEVIWKFNWRVTNFNPAVLLTDMDRDGTLDVVVNTYDRTFVFDGGNGRTKMDLTWPSGRNYGTTLTYDVDGDGYPDVVTLADNLREHIAVIKNERGKSLKLLWDNFYEQNYPEDFKSLRITVESVGDFDGDGRTEIAASLFDGKADSRWHTFLLDALTGKVKSTLPDKYLLGTGALFPGQPPVLFLATPAGRSVLNTHQIAIWSVQGGHWSERIRLEPGTLLSASSFRDFALNVWSTQLVNTTLVRPMSRARSTTGIFQARADGAGRQGVVFLTGDAQGKLTPRWQATLLENTTTNAALLENGARPRRSNLPDQVAGHILDIVEVVGGATEPQLIIVRPDNTLRIAGADGTIFGTLKAQTGFVTQPVVARLGKGELPSVLFLDAAGNVRCLRADAPGAPVRLRWMRPAVGSRPRLVTYLDSMGVPVVIDWDGDGEREVFVASAPNALVALASDGQVKQIWTFPALPTQWTFGHFDGDDRLDLFVSWPSGAFVDMDSAIFSGKNGKEIWRSHCGNGPPAVIDLNGDGRDDILLRDLFERRSLDAQSGKDIHPITLWAGYHAPALFPLKGEKHPKGVVWIGGVYSLVVENEIGKQSWWRPFRATGPQAVADIDGDGRYEIGGVSAGQLYNWPQFYAVDSLDKMFVCYDALTGRVNWSLALGTTASGVVAADIDGDGKPEFLFGTTDGRLVALRGGEDNARRVVWELSFPAALGPPVVCDLEGNGAMSILVSCADGMLYTVRGKP
jgi:hypothetical protein